MNPTLARLLLRLYPRPWRDRYGAEFEALLQTGRGGLRTSVDVARAALAEHVHLFQGANMTTYPQSFAIISRRPSASLPVAMSLLALTAVLIHVGIYGIVHEADEGATAHIWQILMAAQLPLLAYSLLRSLPRPRKQPLTILGVQAGLVLANLAAVFFLT